MPYKIKQLTFDARTLAKNDAVARSGDDLHGQLYFPHHLAAAAWTTQANETPAMIHPGVKMRYSHVQEIPDTQVFVLLHGLLDYSKKGLQTRADIVCKVPDQATASPEN